MTRMLAATLLLVTVACASATGPEGRLVAQPIQVDSVEVAVAESFPVQVFAHVKGVIGDGCSSLKPPIVQARDGNLVRVTILRDRPEDAVCTQIARLFDQSIRLEGDFPPGSYTLAVNRFTTSFRID